MLPLLTLSLGLVIGWYASDLRKRIKHIEILSLIRSKKENPEKPKSMIVEHLSVGERAIKEQEDLLNRLNP